MENWSFIQSDPVCSCSVRASAPSEQAARGPTYRQVVGRRRMGMPSAYAAQQQQAKLRKIPGERLCSACTECT